MTPLTIAPLILACLANDPSCQDDVYRKLALGDRVEVTFLSGATMTGRLVPAPRGTPEKVTSIDYGREKNLTIDVGLEYPGLNGTMTVSKNQLKAIRKIQNLDPKTAEEIRRQKAVLKQQQEDAASQPRPVAPAAGTVKPETPAAKPTVDVEAEKKKEEDLKKGRELLTKYPPSEWSADRHTGIRLKMLRGLVPTAAEKEFFDGFALWEVARNAEKGKGAAPKKP